MRRAESQLAGTMRLDAQDAASLQWVVFVPVG